MTHGFEIARLMVPPFSIISTKRIDSADCKKPPACLVSLKKCMIEINY